MFRGLTEQRRRAVWRLVDTGRIVLFALVVVLLVSDYRAVERIRENIGDLTEELRLALELNREISLHIEIASLYADRLRRGMGSDPARTAELIEKIENLPAAHYGMIGDDSVRKEFRSIRALCSRNARLLKTLEEGAPEANVLEGSRRIEAQVLEKVSALSHLLEARITATAETAKGSVGRRIAFAEASLTVTLVLVGALALLLLLILFAIRAEKRAPDLSLQDAITGLYNRKVFMEFLRHDLDWVIKFNESLSIALVQILDATAEEKTLRKAARAMRSLTPGVDILARFEGGVFAALFPENGEKACLLTVRVIARKVCEETGMALAAGVASYPFPGETVAKRAIVRERADHTVSMDRIVAHAEAALELARRRGAGSVAAFSETRPGS